MHLFHAEPQILTDLRDESEPVAEKEHRSFKVYAVRHPTLGKLVVVEAADGTGIVVETEE
jgi:hypothetical protein